MRYYSIHSIVGVSIDDTYPWLETLNNDLPKVFESNKSEFDKCQYTICICYINEKITTQNKERLYVDKSSFVDKTYGVKIIYDNQNIKLITNQECNEWLMFLLYYQFIKAGYLLIHAAALEKKGEVLIIPSTGGTGKTILSLYLIKKEQYRLLGDDLCLINSKGEVLAFPKKMVIYPWHSEFLNDQVYTPKRSFFKISKRTKESIKLILRRFPAVLAYIRRKNPQLNQVEPQAYFASDGLAFRGQATKMVYLERGGSDKEYPYEELIVKVITTTQYELFHYFAEILDELIRNHSIVEGRLIYVEPINVLNGLKTYLQYKTASIPQNISNKEFIEEFLKII